MQVDTTLTHPRTLINMRVDTHADTIRTLHTNVQLND